MSFMLNATTVGTAMLEMQQMLGASGGGGEKEASASVSPGQNLPELNRMFKSGLVDSR